MDLGVRNRAYLLTGGSAGLGYATAKELVTEGRPDVAIVSGDEEHGVGPERVGRCQLQRSFDPPRGRMTSAYPPADQQ